MDPYTEREDHNVRPRGDPLKGAFVFCIDYRIIMRAFVSSN